MNWEVFIGIFMLLGGLAAVIDLLLRENSIRTTQVLVANWQKQLATKSHVSLIQDSNHYFNRIFNDFYGERHFSVKVIIRSSLTSVFALIVCILIAIFMAKKDALNIYDIVDIDFMPPILLINLVADYFSLIETRWILRISQGKPIGVVFILLVIDIIFTFLCYCFTIILVVYIGVGELIIETTFVAMSEVMWKIHQMTPFLWSTFFTSILFYLFVVNTLLIKILHRLDVPMNNLLVWYATSKNPVKTIVGIMAAFVLILEGFKRIM